MRTLAGVLCLSLSPGALASPGIADCGLEPPGSPDWGPVPRRRFERPGLGATPHVRRVGPESGEALQGPWGAAGAGALAGKTVYLSPGHGFTQTIYGWRTQRGNNNGIVEDLVSAEAVEQFLLRYLRQAGARVVTVREPDLNGRMVVVDDRDRLGYREQGAARFSGGPPGYGASAGPLVDQQNPFALGASRLLATTKKADAAALFVPAIPAAGEYNVYVAYAPGDGRAPDAHYVVRHPGGEAHFRIDQRRHGGTWVLLGRFYFAAGASAEKGAVRVDNDSAVPGATVSLDAVRFGGGMGLIDRGEGVSGRPRWEESARYHAQYNGAPAAVFDQPDLEDHSDDVGTRSRFAAWDHEDGEDAVYLAWHTNAPDPGVGTSSYVYGPNPPDGSYMFTGVPGSDQLMKLVHDEIVGDVRKGWDPGWRDRGKYSAYFGEVNPRHNPEMPAALIEIAFHSTASDALQLKQTPFRHLVARAMYQGVAKFFAQKDGTPLRLLPEPPAAVCARGSGTGEVTVSWRPAPLGTAGLGGDGAERYRVYRSEDGRSWDEGTETAEPRLVVGEVPAGSAVHLRVSAINQGGESFASPLVVARPRRDGARSRVLLIGGFDRADGGMLVKQDLSAYSLGTVQRLLLDQMNDGSYLSAHARALVARDISFDSCLREALDGDDVRLTDYGAVDWQAGEQSQNPRSLSDGQRERLSAHLSRGGRLILSGSEIFWALLDRGNEAEKALGAKLGVSFLEDDAGTYEVRAAPGRLFDGLPPFQFDDGSHGTYDVDFPDVLAPRGGARFEFVYGMGDGAAAVSAGAPTQAVSFGFPLETIYDEALRAEVLGRSLLSLGVPADGLPMDRPPPSMEEMLPDMDQGCACRVAPAGAAPAAPPWPLLALLCARLVVRRRRLP